MLDQLLLESLLAMSDRWVVRQTMYSVYRDGYWISCKAYPALEDGFGISRQYSLATRYMVGKHPNATLDSGGISIIFSTDPQLKHPTPVKEVLCRIRDSSKPFCMR